MPHKPKDEDRVIRWVEKWKKLLYLEPWYIEVHFKQKQEDDNEPLATMAADVKYNQGRLTIYDGFWDRRDQESVILHELCHILTQPMRGLGWDVTQGDKPISWRHFDDANEHETEWVSGVIWRLYNQFKK